MPSVTLSEVEGRGISNSLLRMRCEISPPDHVRGRNDGDRYPATTSRIKVSQ